MGRIFIDTEIDLILIMNWKMFQVLELDNLFWDGELLPYIIEYFKIQFHIQQIG